MRGAKGQPNLEAFEDRHQASYLDGRQYHGRLGLVVASWSFGRGGILQMGGGGRLTCGELIHLVRFCRKVRPRHCSSSLSLAISCFYLACEFFGARAQIHIIPTLIRAHQPAHTQHWSSRFSAAFGTKRSETRQERTGSPPTLNIPRCLRIPSSWPQTTRRRYWPFFARHQASPLTRTTMDTLSSTLQQVTTTSTSCAHS